jgi:hypothetical protein
MSYAYNRRKKAKKQHPEQYRKEGNEYTYIGKAAR